jgi:HlyD family secretion protein
VHARITSVWTSAALGLLLVVAGLFFLRLELVIRAPGTVNARDEVRVFSPMDGVIAQHRIQLGQSVTNGELLLTLDDTELSLRALAIERELAETEAALEQNRIAQAELQVKPGPAELVTADERRERLARIATIQQEIEKNYTEGRDLQIISELEVRRQEIERLRSELDLLQASLLAAWQKAGVPAFEGERLAAEQKRLTARAELAQRERELVLAQRVATQIAAPAAGDVISLSTRFPGMAVTRGTELLKLAATGGPCRVRTYIPERNVDLVRIGTRALMESAVFESMLEGYVEGTVVRVAPEGATASETTPARYEVDIDVQKTPYPLVLGSGVNVRLMLGRRPLSDLLLRSGGNLRQPAEASP